MFVFVLVYITFAIILTRKRELFALLLLSFGCRVIVNNVLWLFLTVPWVGLQFVIVILTYFMALNVNSLFIVEGVHIMAQ